MSFWKSINEATLAEFGEETLPLAAHSSKEEEFSALAWSSLHKALEIEKLELSDLMIKRMDTIRLRPAARKILLRPEGLEVSGPLDDELNEGKKKLVAKFTLPRGCFATIIMKRLGMRRSV